MCTCTFSKLFLDFVIVHSQYKSNNFSEAENPARLPLQMVNFVATHHFIIKQGTCLQCQNLFVHAYMGVCGIF